MDEIKTRCYSFRCQLISKIYNGLQLLMLNARSFNYTWMAIISVLIQGIQVFFTISYSQEISIGLLVRISSFELV